MQAARKPSIGVRRTPEPEKDKQAGLTELMSVELMRTPMSWRGELNPGCDLHQVLYRDDGEVLGCVLRLEGDPSIYAHTVTHDALRRLGAHPAVDAARRAVERAIQRRALWL